MEKITAVFKAQKSHDWLAYALFLLYVIVLSTLTIRQHQSFNTNALDLAKFDQSIWNTAQGRPFQISIGEDFVIASHFSPSLALFAPVYWVWPDIRALFILQSLLMAGSGFLIYWFFREKNPWLGLIVFAAYLMQPALHQVNLIEFRRLTLAVFGTSFAIYHLLRKQYVWMGLGLLLAILSKEDMSLTAIAFGLYIVFFQREWKVGLITFFVGVFWLVLIPFSLLPTLMTHDQTEGYQHAVSYYDYLGDSLPEIVQTAISNPGLLFEFAGQPDRLQAVFNLVWPSAFLFILAPGLAFFMLPHLGFLLTSTSDGMGTLQGWYPSVLIIIIFWAVAVGTSNLKGYWQKLALALLLAASFAGWLTMSQLWPGKKFDAGTYQVTTHEKNVGALLNQIPSDASVMAQDPIVPHLSHRQEIHLFPWNRSDQPAQFIVLDQQLRTYPLSNDSYRSAFFDVFAGQEYALVNQLDSFFVFEYVGEDVPQLEVDEIWDGAFNLQGFSVAAALPDQSFTNLPDHLPAGTTVRTMLFWEAAAEMGQNYTVFVHAVGADDQIVGQSDSWPADSHRPTSVLQVGEKIRDIHYLTLTEAVNTNDLNFRVGLYEAINGRTLLDSQGQPYLELDK